MSTLSEVSQSGIGWVYPPQPQTEIVTIEEIVGIISGISPLIEDQDYIDVLFGADQPSADWVLLDASIENVTDITPVNVWRGLITDKTTTGFRLQLNGTADSDNYVLSWSIRGAFGYYFSGPTSGEELVASTAFSVSLPDETSLTSTVIITPSDGGDGGTFTPSTVSLTALAPSATFTYTPASTGFKTLSVTNNRGLINPASRTYESTAAPPVPHLLDTLISYWKLDEASGTRNDSTASANHLTDNNTVTSAAGVISDAAVFAAANSEYLSIASNASLQVATDFTFSVWVKLESAPSANPYVVLGKGVIASREHILYYHPSNGFAFDINAGGSAAQTGVAVSNGVWTHVVFWYTISDGLCHIKVNNAATITAVSSSALLTSNGVFCIGAMPNPAWYMDGTIDEVGFWKRTLTPTEITALYNGGSGLPYGSFTA